MRDETRRVRVSNARSYFRGESWEHSSLQQCKSEIVSHIHLTTLLASVEVIARFEPRVSRAFLFLLNNKKWIVVNTLCEVKMWWCTICSFYFLCSVIPDAFFRGTRWRNVFQKVHFFGTAEHVSQIILETSALYLRLLARRFTARAKKPCARGVERKKERIWNHICLIFSVLYTHIRRVSKYL